MHEDQVVSRLRVKSNSHSGIAIYSGITQTTVFSPSGIVALPEVTGSIEYTSKNGRDQVNNGSRDNSVGDHVNNSLRDNSGNDLNANLDKMEAVGENISGDVTDSDQPTEAGKKKLRPSTVPLLNLEKRSGLRSGHIDHQESVKLTKYSMFGSSTLATRPQTAAPRVVVPPKHTCPSGLTARDVIIGHKLTNPSNAELSGDFSSTSSSLLHGRQSLDTGRSMKPRKPFKHEAHSFSHGSAATRSLSAAGSRPFVQLELTIVSIDPRRTTNAWRENSTSTAASTTASINHLPDQNYRRVQSAPAVLRLPNRPYTPLISRQEHAPQLKTGAENKQFSNVYWRARSSYHRKQIDKTSDGSSEAEVSTAAPVKGSLLRPLLYHEQVGLMKHSAGCPYKCKECFKACLVSEDYMKESTQLPRPANINARSRPSLSKPDPLAIVRRALGRSQPLYKTVYGEDGGGKVCPWPTYAWVDIKSNGQKTI